MSNVLINNESMTAIANAIRQKKSVTDTYKPSEMAPAILTIDGGGSTPVVKDVGVWFVDYDGVEIDVWDRADIANKTELPTPPAHDGLVFEGWNWTLEDIKADTTGQVITVGPNYHTASGCTEIIVNMNKQLGMTIYYNSALQDADTIDWGDGTIEEWSSSTFPTHTYTTEGTYTIKRSTGYSIPEFTLGALNVVEIRYSNTITVVYAYNLGNPTNLERIAIPSSVSSYNNYNYIQITNTKLKQLTINPHNKSYSNIGNDINFAKSTISNNYYMIALAMPKSEFNLYYYALACNTSLRYIYLNPNAYVYAYALSYNTSLKKVKIPRLASIDVFCFCYNIEEFDWLTTNTSIPQSTFYECWGLKKIIIPDSVTSINASAFDCCKNVEYVKMSSVPTIKSGVFGFSNRKNTTYYQYDNCPGTRCYFDFSGYTSVPTLESTTAFSDTYMIKAIVVPDSLYDEWVVATNWSTFSSVIKKASEV